MTTLAARLATGPDAERLRLRLGTLLIEHMHALWPMGVPEEATPEFIRDNIDGIVAVLDQMLHHDGLDVRRLLPRLHWLLWELADDDRGRPRDGQASR